MKKVEFNQEKSRKLKKQRGVSFEEVSQIIKKSGFVGVLKHHSKKNYSKQKMFLVQIEDYIFVIPFVEDETKIFLKTIYPSRKYTKRYIK